MAEFYRVEVQYKKMAVDGRNLDSARSGGFGSGGSIGIIWLNVDEMRWFAPAVGKSVALAQAFFGDASGTLKRLEFGPFTGTNIEMHCNGKCVGTYDQSVYKTLKVEGLIITKVTYPAKKGAIIPGTAVGVASEGMFFRRAMVWSDYDNLEKFMVILERAQNYAQDEVLQMIKNFKAMIVPFFGIMALLFGVGSLCGPVVAFVMAAVLGLAAFSARGQEYFEKLKIVNAAMKSSTMEQYQLDEAGRALADFFRLVLEDVILALTLQKATKVANKYKSGKKDRAVAKETIEEAFTRAEKEFKEGKAKAEQRAERNAKLKKQEDIMYPAPLEQPNVAKYTNAQRQFIQENAFEGMPSFKNRPYEDLRKWLTQNGYSWQKKEIVDGAKGGNSNAGGSEIWVRRSSKMNDQGLCEVVRLDRHGHTGMNKDGPYSIITNPKGDATINRGAGTRRHFHKDVVPLDRLNTYCKQYVQKIICVTDSGNVVKDGPNFFADSHIELAGSKVPNTVTP